MKKINFTNHVYQPQSKLWKQFTRSLWGIIPSASRYCSTNRFSSASLTESEFHNKNGFTLLEVIVVMILVGIVAVALSGVIIYGVKNYIFGRDAGQLSQRAQLALARIDKELIEATAVTVANNNQITYTSSSGNIYILLLNGTQITLNQNGTGAQILISGVTANNGGNNFLTFTQTDGSAWTTPAFTFAQLTRIQVWITLDILNAGNHLDFQTSINPRSNGLPNAPLMITQ
jgi:prepilin-type N-terminal cleavage/methylation domain-containing protein